MKTVYVKGYQLAPYRLVLDNSTVNFLDKAIVILDQLDRFEPETYFILGKPRDGYNEVLGRIIINHECRGSGFEIGNNQSGSGRMIWEAITPIYQRVKDMPEVYFSKQFLDEYSKEATRLNLMVTEQHKSLLTEALSAISPERR